MKPHTGMNLRTVIMLVLLVAVVVVTAVRFRDLYENPNILRPFDYMEYWSAGRATLNGQNPYDGDVLYPLQQQIGTKWDKPTMMWNPPWTLPMAMTVGAMHWRMGQLVWFVANLACVLLSAVLLWRLYGGEERHAWVGIAVASLFAPTPFLLLLGQISGFMLLGLVGFLWYVRAERFALAGALAALTAIKPHLLVPFALVLALQSLRGNPVWKSVVAGGIVLAVGSIIPLAWNSQVWSQYREATGAGGTAAHYTIHDWQHPTLGWEIRSALPGQPFAAMFIPLAVALPFVIGYWFRRRREWNWITEMPRLVLLSLIVTPYGAWAFDLVLPIVPVVQATTWIVADNRRWLWIVSGSLFVVLNLQAISTVTEKHSMANPWIAPGTVLGYLLAACLTARSPVQPPSPANTEPHT